MRRKELKNGAKLGFGLGFWISCAASVGGAAMKDPIYALWAAFLALGCFYGWQRARK